MLLSISASVISPECRLSAAVSQVATALESLFLVLEHEERSHVASNALNPPCYPSLDPSLPLPTRPREPDAAVASQVCLRCGANQRTPARDAVAQVLKPILQHYRSLLPLSRWRAACMQSMRVVELSMDMLSTAPGPGNPDAQAAGAGKADTAERNDSQVSSASAVLAHHVGYVDLLTV